MKKGFTLIEMLVVIGIIAILIGVAVTNFAGATKATDKQKDGAAVESAANALAALFEKDGAWPPTIRDRGAQDGLLNKDVAIIFHKRGVLSMTVKNGVLSGKDRLGMLTPWAQKELERLGPSASEASPMPGGHSINDHILHFAVDLDGDGIIRDANVGGETIDINVGNTHAAVWSCGKDGVIEPYSQGLKSDDVYSWQVGQTKGIE